VLVWKTKKQKYAEASKENMPVKWDMGTVENYLEILRENEKRS